MPNNYDKLGTCPKPKRPNLKTDYWFNEECKKAKKTRNYYQNRWEKYRYDRDLEHLREAERHFKYVVNQAKHKATEEFLETLDINDNPGTTWKKLNALNGKSKTTTGLMF